MKNTIKTRSSLLAGGPYDDNDGDDVDDDDKDIDNDNYDNDGDDNDDETLIQGKEFDDSGFSQRLQCTVLASQ